MALALQIDPGMPIERIHLPDDLELRSRSIRTRLGASPDPGYYHRQAVMWTHGDGARSLPPNLVATALASAWRQLDIGTSYFLHGRVIVTAANEEADLRADLCDHADAVAQVIAGRAQAWQSAPPTSNEAAWAEIIELVFALN